MEIDKQRAKHTLNILTGIDRLLDKLEESDPYGDIVQNFEDIDRTRHTRRLAKMIIADLAGLGDNKIA